MIFRISATFASSGESSTDSTCKTFFGVKMDDLLIGILEPKHCVTGRTQKGDCIPRAFSIPSTTALKFRRIGNSES